MTASAASSAEASRSAARKRRRDVSSVLLWQIVILVAIAGAWEGLTRIPWFANNTILDPFFISRPSLIVLRIIDWVSKTGTGSIWPNLWSTLSATFAGLFISVTTGFLVGLILGQSRFLAAVFSPFIVALNSMPRVAFVPLITMLFGLGLASKVATAWFAVFFLVFFNAYKGSLSIDQELINFCRTLGANRIQMLLKLRVPTTLAWTFAALPNAISFSLIAVVLSEFIGSPSGIGYILVMSLAALNATDMFAAIIILSLVGMVLVYLAKIIERRVLHWMPEFQAAR